MTPATRHKYFNLGCLGALGGLIGSVVLGILVHPWWFIGIPGVVVIWSQITGMVRKADERHVVAIIGELFASFEGGVPQLVMASSYGWPSFRLIFESRGARDAAQEEGIIPTFREVIQREWAFQGTAKNPFDAERAVSAGFEGEFDSDPIPSNTHVPSKAELVTAALRNKRELEKRIRHPGRAQSDEHPDV